MIGIDVTIPQDAVEVKISNIFNPYYVRIQKAIDNRNRKNDLYRMLQKVVKHQLRGKSTNDDYTPKIGDDVILSANHMNNDKVDLPSWICRGVITDTTSKTTDVFLLDYGTSINVPTDSLIKYSRSLVSLPVLTETVGIYNILPVDSKFCISSEWSKSTINIIKDFIQTSKKIYFDVLAYDRKTNKKYGDFYLVIENTNICLSKVLIYSQLAVPLYDKLLQAINKYNIGDDILVPYQLKECETTTENIIPTELSNDSFVLNNKSKSRNEKKKQMNERLLIQSKFTCQPLEHLEDAKFTVFVHKALGQQGLRTPKHIQSYMWPSIKQGLNVVCISSQGAGKTLGYAVPILNSIATNEEALVEKQKNCSVTKPTVLILCASINKCIDVTTKCKEILYYHDTIKSFAAINGLSDKQLMTSICNKFHVLVSTPPFLVRLLEKYSNKLNLSELSHVILDQADDLLNKYLEDLGTLIRKHKIISKNNKDSIQERSKQIVVAARTWTDRIRSFVDMFMTDPFICIGSFTEAAAFCGVRGRMLIRHLDKKKHEVLRILGDYLKIKTMIFCINKQEATELNDFLTQNSIQTLLVHEEMQITKIHEIREDWAKYLSGMYPVIICTDQVLSELEISDVDFLIHYSITNTSKTQFNRRFSVLMDNWLTETNNKCKVVILLDETKENDHFKGVVNILRRLNVQLPSDWSEMADGFDLAHNLKKSNYSLCDSIKSFGVCNISSCPYRHRVIADVDAPKNNININDELKLHVTYIHSASHISARVLEGKRKCSETGKIETITYPYEILKLSMKMKQYYSEVKNRRMVKDLCVGKVCASRNSEKIFSRVQVLNIVEKDARTDEPKIVRIRNIDDGQRIDRFYVHDLYEISDEFMQFKFTVIDIFLTGIAPFDDEYKWTDIAVNESQDWFKKNSGATSFVFAKVLLHLDNSVWTDSLSIRSKLHGYPDLVSTSLKDFLKKKGHGIENKDHLTKLLHLCHSGSLTTINGHPLNLIINKNEKNNAIDECY